MILQPTDEFDYLTEDYLSALNLTKNPLPEFISRNLTPIRFDNSELVFDTSGRVLFAFLGKVQEFSENESESTVFIDTFVTAVPELKIICQGMNELRLKQILGFPPNLDVDGVIEVFANIDDVFRPCPDPQVYDQECEISVLLRGKDAGLSQIPWYCDKGQQVSYKTSSVNVKHFEWMCNRWKISYLNDEVFQNRPWNGLGYSFDWGKNEFGLSEFILPAFTKVKTNRIYTLEQYC